MVLNTSFFVVSCHLSLSHHHSISGVFNFFFRHATVFCSCFFFFSFFHFFHVEMRHISRHLYIKSVCIVPTLPFRLMFSLRLPDLTGNAQFRQRLLFREMVVFVFLKHFGAMLMDERFENVFRFYICVVFILCVG